jgi:hypothetical protein
MFPDLQRVTVDHRGVSIENRLLNQRRLSLKSAAVPVSRRPVTDQERSVARIVVI